MKTLFRRKNYNGSNKHWLCILWIGLFRLPHHTWFQALKKYFQIRYKQAIWWHYWERKLLICLCRFDFQPWLGRFLLRHQCFRIDLQYGNKQKPYRHLTKIYYIISPSARIDKTINMSLGFSVYPKGYTKSCRITFGETVNKDKPSISRRIGKIHPTVQATPGIIFYHAGYFSGS